VKNIIKLVRILLAVDVGVVLFCLLENNISWFLNTQIAFFSASMIILGSFVGYKNLVSKSVEMGNSGKDVLKEYEDKYEMYDEIDYKWYVADFNDLNKGLIWSREKPDNFYILRKIELVTDDNPQKTKLQKLPWYKAFFLSFKGGFNLLRIAGYIVLILGFLWLNRIERFDFAPYFFGLTLVPALALIYLWIERRENKN
jgi:hypothetical protein